MPICIVKKVLSFREVLRLPIATSLAEFPNPCRSFVLTRRLSLYAAEPPIACLAGGYATRNDDYLHEATRNRKIASAGSAHAVSYGDRLFLIPHSSCCDRI